MTSISGDMQAVTLAVCDSTSPQVALLIRTVGPHKESICSGITRVAFNAFSSASTLIARFKT